jgi:hypothetical protein
MHRFDLEFPHILLQIKVHVVYQSENVHNSFKSMPKTTDSVSEVEVIVRVESRKCHR